MSYPFKRSGDHSPDTPSYFSGHNSPQGASPTWGGSRKGDFDFKKIAQVVGTVLGLIALFSVVRSIFAPTAIKEEYTLEGVVNRNQFVDFEGGLDCRLSSTELYIPPLHNTPQARKAFPYCQNRAKLLEGLSSGGRHGYDQPYMPHGCHYKWYSAKEICMILDRFDGVVFVGDKIIHDLYAAFNILLRQDLALGGMQQWKMSDKERDSCRCSKQYTNPDCNKYFVTSSDEVGASDPESNYRAPYVCNRIPHFYLPIGGSPAPDDLKARFGQLLDKDPHSWKPVGIIHSLGLATHFDWPQATDSMDEWLTIADNSGRNTPFLWVGPNAAGPMKAPAKIMQEGNNALWHYTLEMGKEAVRRGVEQLALYNSTLQASSWDGDSYGERVNLVNAMMIINWLSKLETT